MSAPGDLLYGATDGAGRRAADWLDNALAGGPHGPAMELRSAPSGLVTVRRLGVSGRAMARPGRLPMTDNALAEIRATMCLPALEPLDDLFAEVRRVLRPTGTLAALVPSRPRGSIGELRAWWPLHRAAGGAPTFRNESARDRLSWLFTAADFAVLVEQRRTFWVPLPDADRAEHVVAGLVASGVWPADLPPDRLGAAATALASSAGPGRRLPVPLRLLIGRR